MKRAVKKISYMLKGGPFNGEKVELSSPKTLVFRSKGLRGHYGARHIPKYAELSVLSWFPAKEA